MTVPHRGTAPDGGILLIGVPADILPILHERSIVLLEVPSEAGDADATETDGDVRIGFPVKCPLCGKSWMMGFRPTYLAEAFNDREPIRFYSTCCYHDWNASEKEAQRIRGLLDQYDVVAGTRQ
jgi:hypothetical protein